ncbi:MAG: hypothetical protein K2J48_03660 [Muribaculaceae bacterium]|nr:hypothetical protein [Muribaculaceae bacterium]
MVILSLSISTQSLLAQETIENDSSLSIQDLNERITSLNLQLGKQKELYEKQLSDLRKHLEKLKDKSEVAKAEDEIQVMRFQSDSLYAQIKKDSLENAKLKVIVNQQKDSIILLKDELQSLAIFRKDFLLNIFRQSNEYLQLPYSEISEVKLNDMKSKLSEYSSDPEVKEAINALDDAISYKGFVNDMNHALSSPLDLDLIRKARDSFSKLKSVKDKFSPSQWEEFDNLDKYLSRYRISTKAFQTMIDKINNIIDQYGGMSSNVARMDCVEEINEVFKPYEEREIKLGLMIIPYLIPRFEKYRKWATSNPLQKDKSIIEIESEIMNLNTNN